MPCPRANCELPASIDRVVSKLCQSLHTVSSQFKTEFEVLRGLGSFFGDSWGVLGSLGAFRARLRRTSSVSWSVSVRLGGFLGPLGEVLGQFLGSQEASWEHLGSIFEGFHGHFRDM